MLARLISVARKLDDVAERILFSVLVPWMKQNALLLVLLAAATAGFVNGFRAASVAEPATAPVIVPDPSESGPPVGSIMDSAFLLDRAWIDNPSANARDKFSLWFFSDHARRDGAGLWAVYQHGAPAKSVNEFFLYNPEGSKLNVRSLWDKRQFGVHFQITREKQKGVDLKLVLKKDPHHGGNDHVYWSRLDKWRRAGAADPGVVARALLSLPDAE